jgi:hypothetical protein
MDASTNEDVRAKQRDAIWKWRWLGWRDSTPGFKGALVLLAVAAVGLAVFAGGLLRF